MMLFSIQPSEITSFNYTLYTQLLSIGFFCQSLKFCLSPFSSTFPKESEVLVSRFLSIFSFILFSQMPLISCFKEKNNSTKHSHTLVLNTQLERAKPRIHERHHPSFWIMLLNSDIPVSSRRKIYYAKQCTCSARSPFPL